MTYSNDDWFNACKDCESKCCQGSEFYFVTDKEIERIKEAGHTNFHEENLLKRINNQCIFFKDNKCIINDIKPEDCKRFPVLHFFDKGVTVYYLDLSCPLSKSLPKEEIDNLIKRTDEFIASMTNEERKNYKKKYMQALKRGFDFD